MSVRVFVCLLLLLLLLFIINTFLCVTVFAVKLFWIDFSYNEGMDFALYENTV